MEISGQLQLLFTPHPGKLLDSQHIGRNIFYGIIEKFS
jgi:hypothetical protein